MVKGVYWTWFQGHKGNPGTKKKKVRTWTKFTFGRKSGPKINVVHPDKLIPLSGCSSGDVRPLLQIQVAEYCSKMVERRNTDETVVDWGLKVVSIGFYWSPIPFPSFDLPFRVHLNLCQQHYWCISEWSIFGIGSLRLRRDTSRTIPVPQDDKHTQVAWLNLSVQEKDRMWV